MLDDRFGCIIFEDTHQHRVGWAARAEENEARYISDINELESDTVWLTNLPFEISFQSGFSNHSLYRESNFLRTDIKKLNKFLGLSDDQLEEQAYIYCRLFKRVMALANHFLGITEIDKQTLTKSIRKHAGSYDPVFMTDFREKIRSAITHYVWTVQPGSYSGDGQESVNFLLPAIDHAKEILSTPVPVGNWLQVKQLPDKDNILCWAEELDAPAIVRINVQDVDPDIGDYLNFGSGSEKDRKKWITVVELINLLPVANIQVKDAYKSEGFVILDELLDLVESFPEESLMSISTQIFLDNFWTGLTTQHPPPYLRRERDRIEKSPINTICPFYKSQDRLICLKCALQAVLEGFNVKAYGTGKITVDATDASNDELYSLAKKIGLIPPVRYVENINSLNLDMENDPLDLLIGILAKGNYEELLAIDEEFVNIMLES